MLVPRTGGKVVLVISRIIPRGGIVVPIDSSLDVLRHGHVFFTEIPAKVGQVGVILLDLFEDGLGYLTTSNESIVYVE